MFVSDLHFAARLPSTAKLLTDYNDLFYRSFERSNRLPMTPLSEVESRSGVQGEFNFTSAGDHQ